MNNERRPITREDLPMIVLDVVQDDWEALPHITKRINALWHEVLAHEFAVDEIIPVVETLLADGMFEPWLDVGNGMIQIAPSQVVTLRDHPNMTYSSSPLKESIWFRPTDKGQAAYFAWRSETYSLGLGVFLVRIRGVGSEQLFNDMAPAGDKRYPGWLVEFDTRYGSGVGWWIGAQGYSRTRERVQPLPPQVNHLYEVEIEFGSDFTWNVDALPTDDATPAIAKSGAAMILRGELASVDEASGLTTIRLADTLITAAVHGEPSPLGTPILLRAARLFLFSASPPIDPPPPLPRQTGNTSV